MAPTSQKDRPISFALDDGRGALTTAALVIRPEDLSKNDPSLQSTQPTFGGAFLDDFGPGLSSIQISGHTGWGAGNRPDGFEAFKSLYDTVWTSWHDKRKAAVKDGLDPNLVKLIFVDTLDDIVCVVAPGNFSLKRNRSRPLLMMYQIGMTVLDERISSPLKDPLNFDRGRAAMPAGLASLQSSLDKISAKAATLRSFIDANVATPVQNFMNLTTSSFSKVIDAVNDARGIVTAEARQLIGISTDLAVVGRNVFHTFNAVAGLPDFVRHELSSVAAAYENAFCVLRNVFRVVREYPDYSSVYGASNCSSTVGGSTLSPLRDSNAFESIIPSVLLPPSVTAEAKAGVDVLMVTDPVLSPLDVTDVAARLIPLNNGIAFE